MDLEQLLGRVDNTHGLSDEEWLFVVQELVTRLGTFLESETQVVLHRVVDGVAVHSRVRAARSFAGALRLSWFGIVGVEPINDAPYVSAFIFPTAGGQRLAPRERKDSYIELRYERASGWTSLGWRVDEYGEFDHIESTPPAEPGRVTD